MASEGELDILQTLALARMASELNLFADALSAWRKLEVVAPSDEVARRSAKSRSRLNTAARQAFSEEDYLGALKLYDLILPQDAEFELVHGRRQQIGRRLLQQMRNAYKEADMQTVLDNAPVAARIL